MFLAATMAAGCGGSSSKNRGNTTAPTTSGSTAGNTSGSTSTTGSGSVGGVNSNGGLSTPLPPGPELASVKFEDVDQDGLVSPGDHLVLEFRGDVEQPAAGTVIPADTVAALAVKDDSFGTDATVEPGAQSNQVNIVLGNDPSLYISGSFSSGTISAGAASGLNLVPGANPLKGVKADTVQPAKADLDIDGKLNGKFVRAGSLNVSRGAHCSVLLDDGRVLIVGGVRGNKRQDLVAEAELFDPLTATFTKVSDLTGEKGYMKRGRNKVRMFQATAVKLKSGKVLICGGYGIEKRGFFGLGKGKIDTLESAFEFDPLTNEFTRVGDLKHPRHAHTATLLKDGRVLIAGGYNDSFWRKHKTQAPLEVYDPQNKRFFKLGRIFRRTKLKEPRMNHTATSLDGGDAVLFAGGAKYTGGGLFGLVKPKLRTVGSAEAFDGKSSVDAGKLAKPRLMHAAAAITPTVVLIAGGHTVNGAPVRELEAFNANTGVWNGAGRLRVARSNPSIAIHRNLALIVGGHTGRSETSFVEAFDLDTGALTRTSYRLRTARNACSVTRLKDGRVLVVGGLTGSRSSYLSLNGQALASAEMFVSH